MKSKNTIPYIGTEILADGVDFAKVAATAGAACGLCFAESMGIRCVDVDCWNQAFQTSPCHQDAVIVDVIVIVVVPALTKGYIGNAFSGRRLLLH